LYHGLNIPWPIQGITRTRALLAKDTEIANKFFSALGPRIQRLRIRAGYSQEDMISFGYGVRYWQRIEAGKPITLRTLLRICHILNTSMEAVVRGLGPQATKRQIKRP